MKQDLKKIWVILAPAERRKAGWMLLLVVLMAGAETLGVVSIMPFLSVLGRPEIVRETPWLLAAQNAFGFPDERTFIVGLGLASIFLVVCASVFKTITQHVLNRFVQFQRHSFSTRLLSRYLHQPYEFFLTRNAAILSKNVLSEVDQLVLDVIQPLSQLVAQGAVVLAMALLIFCYDPLMALCTLAVLALLYGLIYGLVRQRLARIGHERQAANAQRYQACSEVLNGIKDVKITHSAVAYLEKFNQASRTLARHSATNDTLNQSPLYLVEATGYTGLIVIGLLLLLRSNDVAHVLPALGLYGFAAYRMLPAAQIIYRGFARLRFASAALDVISQDMALAVEVPPIVQSFRVLPVQKEIRLQGIRFAYPASPGKNVLDGFDLVIPANTSIGIAGKSGAGKSTVMDLLLGLLQPQAGSLSIDGEPINSTNVVAWQRAIGYVPQHIYLADASVAENIAFGLPPHAIDRQAMERAARAAQIHDFVIRELPQRYETKVGDKGIRLSGGQRQRIGIARALYRDPTVIFMDEATSALDGETEEAVTQAISNLTGQKTLVVIAHREGSLQGFTNIVTIQSSDKKDDFRKLS